uniref:Uncharacterized protein LOC113799031 n=1 Tax=Dermatophagoides pteronyssinus TaxID=6956 RepID=A0A6P6YIR7_DERPT|nr:uncharacterized protein LOC113799031 [Dermatophagoides pteronyssinus]
MTSSSQHAPTVWWILGGGGHSAELVDTPQCSVLFAESVCRTRTLSATARLTACAATV